MRRFEDKKDRKDDWGGDKSRRQKRFNNKRAHEKKEMKRDFPSRIEQRQHPRRHHVEWQGNDYDYQEEFGDE
jgi:hypothetical protein